VCYWFVGGLLVGGQLAEKQLVRGLPVAVLAGFFPGEEIQDMLPAI
jgi:hypothetical protein